VDSPTNHRPFYATIWFGLVATVAVAAAIVAAAIAMPVLEGRPTRGFGQFGVVLVTIYWVFIFPKLRKIRRDPNK
jgi:hypothetical protein